jgi:putative tricarboxylic transport membrane protein
LGFFLGILPGSGAAIPTFISYTMEKRLSKHPEKFGRGAIEGVAGPESANNAGSTGTFVPLFTLGIPSNSVMAMLLGALMIHGLQPGPFLIKSNPEIFWGTIVSMYLGNIMLLILNLPLIGVWVKLLKVPYQILSPLILFFCVIGSYTIRNSVGDVIIMFIFGIIGFVFIKYQYEPAPLVMAFVLGDLLETSLRQSLLMSGGSFVIFITRPFSAACLLVTLLLLSANLLSRRHRETISKLA